MRWFRRRRGVDVGTYVAPPAVERPPVERVAEDGVLIGEAIVRVTLRNRIIVNVLRDARDLDRHELTQLAAAELRTLAEQSRDSAERLRYRREGRRPDGPLPEYAGFDGEEWNESVRRETVHRAMARAFADRAGVTAALDALVERSLAEAWDEVASVLLTRAEAIADDRDAHYEEQREERIAALLALDLSALAAERGVEL